jgi:hypothetical protein
VGVALRRAAPDHVVLGDELDGAAALQQRRAVVEPGEVADERAGAEGA